MIGLHKTECIRQPGLSRNLTDVEYAAAGWVDCYHHRRLHSCLGSFTPADDEAAPATLTREPQPV